MTRESSIPRVSVITTVHNAEAFLETTLCSLLAQSYTDFESVVIDDGSEDGSADLVERLAASDPRIRLIRQRNAGYSNAVNRGLAEARGELIAFLDHDDLWRQEKLQRQIERLEHNPRAGLVSCFSALLDSRHHCTGWRFGARAEGSVYRQMRFCDLVAGGSVPLIRRDVIEAAGGFEPAPEVQGRSDWEAWLRVSRHCEFTTVDEILVGYVRRPGNYSADYQRMIRAGEAVLRRAAETDPELDHQVLRRARARDAFGVFCLALADGRVDEAGGILRQSLHVSKMPVLHAPRRWGIVLLFAFARLLPAGFQRPIWSRVATAMFGLTPGTPFLPDSSPAAD
ncbi:glycosyltransferase family 2 protein [Elongatibacter sediminis]|uniref:Glycosyltransferase family 2 protein n=1 Tax=Elongatibacter sediminis TaxID=3119006 RepID=A0AAW9RC31_9GAMM